MTTRPAIFAIMEYLEEKCPTLGIPVPKLEWLDPEGVSIAVVQTDQPTVQKTYINGTSHYRLGLNIIAQGTTAERLDLISYLSSLLFLFEGMAGTDIAEGMTVTKVDTTTPSLDAQGENLIVRYRFSATVYYGG